MANVLPVSSTLEMYGRYTPIGFSQCFHQVLLDSSNGEDSATTCHHSAILQRCASMEHLQPQLFGLQQPYKSKRKSLSI